jgi:hypothetical protein
MKFVAANDFFNQKKFGIKFSDEDKKHELFRHENHVHKGYRFSIGAPETAYNDLQPEQKEMAGLLLKHKLAVIDDDVNAKLGTISKIEKEAAAELAVRKADVQAAKNAAAVSLPAVLKQLSDVLAQNAQLIALLTKGQKS